GIKQVGAAVSVMDQTVQLNAANAEETAAAAEELSGQAESLNGIVRELDVVIHGSAHANGNGTTPMGYVNVPGNGHGAASPAKMPPRRLGQLKDQILADHEDAPVAAFHGKQGHEPTFHDIR
ncbi:MAG TPA: hypothetical protein VF678_09100, partial [bacterium]